jgi:hypothetical protein
MFVLPMANVTSVKILALMHAARSSNVSLKFVLDVFEAPFFERLCAVLLRIGCRQ